MEKLIDALISEIKKDTRYLSFLMQEQRMQEENIQELLKNYQNAVTKYQEVKKYDKHIDISEQLESMKALKKEVSQHPIIQDYYQAYHDVNALLEEVTQIIFKDISVDLSTSRYTF
ncbi:MAG: YlbF family regulator [Coprobacillaceae bacterium]